MKIISLWTSEVDVALEEKIMSCFNMTFSQAKSDNYFQWKFRDNPFGESLHIVVIEKNKVISTRVFWRMDIDGIEAYQCVDTAVLPEHQGKGIFGKTTSIALQILNGKLIYNYPNNLSGPAYIKYGWRAIKDSNSIKVNFTSLMLKSSTVIDWKIESLRWRFENNPEARYFTMKKNDIYYIFSLKKKVLFVLLGKTKFKLDIDNIKPFICFSYDNCSNGLSFYSKLPYMSKGAIEHKLHTYLFDMA